MSETGLSCGPRGIGDYSLRRSLVKNWLVIAIVAIVLTNLKGATAEAGTLTLFDAAGAHPLGSGVQAASVDFGPLGEVLLVTSDSGALTQFDAAGAHLLAASGVRDADSAFGPFGEVLLVTSDSGALTQFDAAGAHLLAASGVQDASIAFGPSGPVLAVVTADLAAAAPVPEPTSIVLFGAGLTGLYFVRVAKRRTGNSYAVQK
jgi:hypothetical protein